MSNRTICHHTPGPWESRAIGLGPHRVYAYGKGGALIATPGHLCDQEQEIANACLIAAAPELLEALEFVVNAYEGSPSNERTMGFYEARNRARAAIAKAQGGAE